MPGAKAVKYAEDMGVHAVYEQARTARAQAEQSRVDLTRHRAQRRMLEQQLTDREFDILSDERGHNPASSVAALERQVKARVNSDPDHRKMRGELHDLSEAIDVAETFLAMAKIDVEIATARMNELGGYLAYLASLKQAETSSLTINSTPWPGVTP